MAPFSLLAVALDGNEALQRRARLAALSFIVSSGDTAATVRVGEGVAVEPGAAAGAAFSLAASPGSWAAFAEAVPPVGFQSLVGMQRVGHLRVEGDLLAYARNLLFLEQLFAVLRPLIGPQRPAAVGEPVIEPVIGATCAWISTASRTESISRKRARAFRSLPSQQVPTDGSTAHC